MKSSIKITFLGEEVKALPQSDMLRKELIVELPFSEHEQYKRFAKIEVRGIDSPAALVNRQVFDCILSISRRGKLEIAPIKSLGYK